MNTDIDLVKKWQEGDFDAEAQLVSRYYKGVKQHIAKIAMGNLDIASDLTTDTFIKAREKSINLMLNNLLAIRAFSRGYG